MSLLKHLDESLRNFLLRRGYAVMRIRNTNHVLGRRIKLLQGYGIDLILDVGANTGQYAERMRGIGYAGEIVSFEPMRAAYERLTGNASGDGLWSCRDFALGDAESESRIHVSGNSVSSSILPMLPEHEKHAPASKVTNDETIRVKRLDGLPDWNAWAGKKGIWLKIDVQGYEDHVLAGASGCLDRVAAIQLELSLRPLYSNQLTLIPMLERLEELGFDPVAFEPGFTDKQSGELLQVDGIFRNRRMR
jgi:FkbM family methyltransferase